MFVFSYPAVADTKNFSVWANATYRIEESGNTRVVYKLELVNKTSEKAATAYKIKIGFNNIAHVTATDPSGSVVPVVKKIEDGYTIEVPFKSRIVGIDKVLNFTLTFDTPDIATKKGNIWEISIPGLKEENDFSSFNARVEYPTSFGIPSFIKPSYVTPTGNNNLQILTFNKDHLKKSGISFAFGEYQQYEFTLKYHLKNGNVFPTTKEIAIPPTTNYQEVYLQSITPAPQNVLLDKDGNWLAQFSLLPSASKEITITGKMKVFLTPKKQELSQQEYALFLKEQPYWQISDQSIKQLARKLRTPQKIYQYVTQHLTYDFSRVTEKKPRLGGKGVLQNPKSAVCLEFTDLFITLARSAGIPAREVNGFAFTKNTHERPLSLLKDVLHSWPEYYDKDLQTWIMVDPTWGNTTGGTDYFNLLDFDHIAFVVKGEKSEYPIPAGGYKLMGNESEKDIKVQFSNSTLLKTEKLQLTPDMPKSTIAGFPVSGNIKIKNVGNVILGPQEISISTAWLLPSNQKIKSPSIPPFGSITIPIYYHRSEFLTNKDEVITIAVDQDTFRQVLHVSPFVLSKEMIIKGGISIVIFGIIVSVFTYTTRRLSVFRS